jgi:transcriptional antiterminator RfaH
MDQLATAAACIRPLKRLRWYLVQCRPRQDDRALEHLERQRFECYRPLHERERIRGGRKYLREEAFFPHYLFIRLDPIHQNWLPVCSTRGVIRIVRFNGNPLPVPDEIIDQIQRRIRGQTEALRQPYLLHGEHVRIIEGSFAGIEAIFLANDGDERVILLLNLLQTEQHLSFPLASVCKV